MWNGFKVNVVLFWLVVFDFWIRIIVGKGFFFFGIDNVFGNGNVLFLIIIFLLINDLGLLYDGCFVIGLNDMLSWKLFIFLDGFSLISKGIVIFLKINWIFIFVWIGFIFFCVIFLIFIKEFVCNCIGSFF